MLSKGKENKEDIYDVLGVDGCGPRFGGGVNFVANGLLC